MPAMHKDNIVVFIYILLILLFYLPSKLVYNSQMCYQTFMSALDLKHLSLRFKKQREKERNESVAPASI